MFNTFFSSLFGKGKENSEENKAISNDDTNCSEESVIREFESEYRVVKLVELNDDEIDWMLVEKQESDHADIETSTCLALVPFQSIFTHLNDDLGNALPANITSMDDSWFLTPPECFTSLNGKSIWLEASPFENLLIEHPSMSVYCNYKREMSNNNDDDLVIIEIGQQNSMISENRKRSSKKSRNPNSQGASTATIYVIKNDNNNVQKCKTNGKNCQGKSAFNRNNKLQLLRHAPKRTILNQPSARMMINNNKKK